MPKNIYQNHNDELKEITLHSIETALALLMKEKDLEEISITDICRKAGVSRNAFYSHFKSKNDIFDHILLEINKEVVKDNDIMFDIKNLNLDFYERLFSALEDKMDMLKIYVNAGFQYRPIMQAYYSLRLKQVEREERRKRMCWLSGIEVLIMDWVNDRKRDSVKEISLFAYQKLTPILKKNF